MISIKERKEVCYGGEPDIFLGNWTKRLPIDEDNQEFDITRRDLEESQGGARNFWFREQKCMSRSLKVQGVRLAGT